MSVVGRKALWPIMLVQWAIVMAVPPLGTEHLHRGMGVICGAAYEPLALGLEGRKPGCRRGVPAAMGPGVPSMPEQPRQEHQGRE